MARLRHAYCVEQCPSSGQSGKHVLIVSSSHFDPERTFLDLDQSRTAAFHKLLAVSQCKGGLELLS